MAASEKKTVSRNIVYVLAAVCLVLIVLVAALAAGFFSQPESKDSIPTVSPTPMATTSQETPTASTTPVVSELKQPNIIVTLESASNSYIGESDTQAWAWYTFNVTNNGNAPAYNVILHVKSNASNVQVVDTDVPVSNIISPQETVRYYANVNYKGPNGTLVNSIDTNSVTFTYRFSAIAPAITVNESIHVLSAQAVASPTVRLNVTLQNTGNNNVTVALVVVRPENTTLQSQAFLLSTPKQLTAGDSPTSILVSKPHPGNYTVTIITQAGNSFSSNPFTINN